MFNPALSPAACSCSPATSSSTRCLHGISARWLDKPFRQNGVQAGSDDSERGCSSSTLYGMPCPGHTFTEQDTKAIADQVYTNLWQRSAHGEGLDPLAA